MDVDPDGHWVWFAIGAGFTAYDAYKAYKSGASRKQILIAGTLGIVGGGRVKVKAAKAVVKNAGRAGGSTKLRQLATD
ncbi:hypothetical protein ACTFQN_25765 [Bacillus cereus group sp. MYBK30-1]|uniref:hypothetical protein n=1 Tax=unclassified Bacillus cereus group TaxID=2750818 RepID=UPI003F7A6E0E